MPYTTDELGDRRGHSEGEQLIRNPRIADARFRLRVLSPNFPNFRRAFPNGIHNAETEREKAGGPKAEGGAHDAPPYHRQALAAHAEWRSRTAWARARAHTAIRRRSSERWRSATLHSFSVCPAAAAPSE